MHASCAKKKYKAPLLAAAVVVRIYVCAVYVFRFNVWIQTLGVAGSRLGSVDPQFWTSLAAQRLLRCPLAVFICVSTKTLVGNHINLRVPSGRAWNCPLIFWRRLSLSVESRKAPDGHRGRRTASFGWSQDERSIPHRHGYHFPRRRKRNGC